MSYAIRTPSDLKYEVESAGTAPHFFDRKTMSFFGDTMRNFGLRKVELPDYGPCFELYRRRPVKHGLQKSAYFSAVTFRRVHPTNESHT